MGMVCCVDFGDVLDSEVYWMQVGREVSDAESLTGAMEIETVQSCIEARENVVQK